MQIGLIIVLQMFLQIWQNNIPLPNKDVLIYDNLEGEVGHTMFLNPVDDQEIIRTVQNCENKMSTDYNDIKMLMVKKSLPKLLGRLFTYAMYFLKWVYFQTK